jgi:hypothetical protein
VWRVFNVYGLRVRCSIKETHAESAEQARKDQQTFELALVHDLQEVSQGVYVGKKL